MNNLPIYYIHWEDQARVYSYGITQTINQQGNVLLQLSGVPAGVMLHQWSFRNNYSLDRRLRQLPLLEGGKEYSLFFSYESVPENRCWVEIEFFDCFGETICTFFIKNSSYDFQVPENYTNYTLTLLNTSMTTFLFKRIMITEKENAELLVKPVFFSEIQNQTSSGERLNVLFVPPEKHLLMSEEPLVPAFLKDTLVVKSNYFFDQCFLTEESQRIIHKKLATLKNQYEMKRIQFVGCERISDQTAIFYTTVYPESRALVFNDFEKRLSQDEMFVERTVNPEKIVSYGEGETSFLQQKQWVL